MKKNISILICFFIIIGLIFYNVYANFKINSSNVSYNFAGGYISVKDHLDDLINETKEISNLGDASTGNVILNKTGYSKGTFITGTMQNYSGVTMSISSVTRDGNYVKFNFPKNGFYGTNSAFKMTFGDQSQFYVKSDGYYSTKSVMKVPSSKVHTKVTLSGTNVSIKNTSDTSISSIYTEVGGTNVFKVIPNTGYYIDNLICTDSDGTVNNAHKLSGYSLGDNANGYNSQNITLTNNNISKDGSCTINAKLRSFNVTIKGDYVATSPSSTTIKYGGTVSVTLVNNSQYYFESMSCTNGYTANLQTGKDYYAAQAITISNNNNIGDTVCTVVMSKRYLEYYAKSGNYVKMVPDKTSASITSTYTGCANTGITNTWGSADCDLTQEIKPANTTIWRVLKVKDDGTIEMVANTVSDLLCLAQISGYNHAVKALNYAASQYTNSNYTIATRSMGYKNQTSLTTCSSLAGCQSYDDSGYTTDYNLVKDAGALTTTNWLASRNAENDVKCGYQVSVRIVSGTKVARLDLSKTKCTNYLVGCSYVRPIVTIRSKVAFTGLGTEAKPYELD